MKDQNAQKGGLFRVVYSFAGKEKDPILESHSTTISKIFF